MNKKGIFKNTSWQKIYVKIENGYIFLGGDMRKKYAEDPLLNEENDEITVGKEWRGERDEPIEQPTTDNRRALILTGIVVLLILIAAGGFVALSATPNNSGESAERRSEGAAEPKIAKPSLLSISIVEAPTTNKNEITLRLYAKNATECRFSNDATGWSEWRAYASEAKWELNGGDGDKIVYYQCRNSAGTSVPVSTAIYLDKTAPFVSLDVEMQNTLARLNAEGSDENPYGAGCTIIIDGKEMDDFIGKISKELDLGKGTHTISINCSDAAGNTATAEKVLDLNGEESTRTPDETTKISILINNGAATTNSRYLTLSLYATGGNLCRYKENNDQWTNNEPYTTTRSWTIEAVDSQRITIYYECKDKNGGLIGQASDSIEYLKNSVGGGSSSGSSGGSSGGSQTLRLNSVTLIPLTDSYRKPGFTNDYRINLEISAIGARECRYRNIPWEPAPVWTDWASYRTSQMIEMLGDRGGDGDRLVEVECRDAKNNTVAGSARIIYDHTPPSEVDTSRPEDMTLIYSEEINGTDHTYVMLVWLPSTDVTAGIYSYNIDKMNVSEGKIVANYKIVYENSSIFYQFIDEVDPTETYIYGFTTYDNANNGATSTRLLYCDPSQPLPANCN